MIITGMEQGYLAIRTSNVCICENLGRDLAVGIGAELLFAAPERCDECVRYYHSP